MASDRVRYAIKELEDAFTVATKAVYATCRGFRLPRKVREQLMEDLAGTLEAHRALLLGEGGHVAAVLAAHRLTDDFLGALARIRLGVKAPESEVSDAS